MLQFILIGVVCIFAIFFLLSECSCYIVYGGYLSNDDIQSYIDEWGGDFQKNPYDNQIILPTLDLDTYGEEECFRRIRDGGYVAVLGFPSGFSSYHIQYRGRVFRFSKGHEKIKELFRNSK